MDTDHRGRIEYIDIAKGIGILLVIFGHVVRNSIYPMHGASFFDTFIYSFHMPLFFVISGLCIKESKRLDAISIRKMTKAYLVPYAIWTVIYMLAFILIEFVSSVDQNIAYRFTQAISLCGLAPLWFLIALFIAEVVILALKQSVLMSRSGCCIALLLLIVITVVSSLWFIRVEENMNMFLKNWVRGLLRIFPTSFFVMIGYLGRSIMGRIVKWKNVTKIALITLMGVIQIVLCLLWNDHTDVQIYILSNPWLYFIKAINGTIIILMFSTLVNYGFLKSLGYKTKELMILHYPPFYYTLVLKYILGKLFEPNVIGAIIITCVTIISCLFIDRMMRKFAVWQVAMGK